MSDRKSRTYEWFIEPLDSDTNRALARELPEEDTLEKHDDKDISRKVYRIPWNKLSMFRNSKSREGFRFNIFVQEGSGRMRSAAFLPAISKRRAANFPRQAQVVK